MLSLLARLGKTAGKFFCLTRFFLLLNDAWPQFDLVRIIRRGAASEQQRADKKQYSFHVTPVLPPRPQPASVFLRQSWDLLIFVPVREEAGNFPNAQILPLSGADRRGLLCTG